MDRNSIPYHPRQDKGKESSSVDSRDEDPVVLAETDDRRERVHYMRGSLGGGQVLKGRKNSLLRGQGADSQEWSLVLFGKDVVCCCRRRNYTAGMPF
jgi:hypothetical protein